MRLLVIYQHAPTPGAPGIYRHRTLLAELVRRGWHVDLVSSPINYMHGTVPEQYIGRRYVREEIDGIHHHWVRASGEVHRSFRHRARNYVTFAAAATGRAMRLPRPDVVWASSPPLSVASAGRWIARRHRRPFVLEVRDLWPESAAAVGLIDPESRAYRLIDRAARSYAARSDAAIVPTPGLVELLHEHGARDVELVTGAIGDHPPDPATRARMREHLEIPADACVFAYVGAHGVVNGLDLLLDAAELLEERAATSSGAAQSRPVHFVLAGDGSDHARISARLAARPIRALQLLGPVPKEEVLDILAAADVGLHLLRPDPLFRSALPTKVLEYLGAHLPFITTVPGLPAEVAAATGGDFAADAAALADAADRWAGMEAGEQRLLGTAANRWGQERYGLGASADRLEAVLRRAIINRRQQ